MDCFASLAMTKKGHSTNFAVRAGGLLAEIQVVIPGRAKREPGIHNHDREYGFRACAKAVAWMSEAKSGTGFRTYRTRMSLRSCGLRCSPTSLPGPPNTTNR